MLDLSGISKVKTSDISEIDQLNINELGDTLSRLTAKRMTPNDKEAVYLTVRELEKYTPISWEFLRYLIATSNGRHKEVISLIGSNHLRDKTKSQINKTKRILKDHCEIIQSKANSYFKKLVCKKGSIGFMNTKRTFHFIRFEKKNLE